MPLRRSSGWDALPSCASLDRAEWVRCLRRTMNSLIARLH